MDEQSAQEQPARKAAESTSPENPSEKDLSREIERTVAREPLDFVKCVRVFGNYYRCNWWSRAAGAAVSGLRLDGHHCGYRAQELLPERDDERRRADAQRNRSGWRASKKSCPRGVRIRAIAFAPEMPEDPHPSPPPEYQGRGERHKKVIATASENSVPAHGCNESH